MNLAYRLKELYERLDTLKQEILVLTENVPSAQLEGTLDHLEPQIIKLQREKNQVEFEILNIENGEVE